MRTWFGVLVGVLVLAGCGKEEPQPNGMAREITIGVIAKSQSNPVFQAARVGAEDAARELSTERVRITIDWRTPNDEDAQQQANNLQSLVAAGVDGIAISCSDASMVTHAINDAVDKGVAVMCFDSDAPESQRFCYHGIDDVACGKAVMRELAKALGPKGGTIAILAGNQTAPNLQKRVQGVRDEAKKHPSITIKDVYYHKETPQDAAAKVEQVQTANPDIAGWAMVGGWPLFTDALLKWEPGKVKIVAVDALPAQLPYVEKGIAQVLLAQQVYKWGHRSVELLVDQIVHGKAPDAARDISELIPVTADNVAEFAKNWETWLPKK